MTQTCREMTHADRPMTQIYREMIQADVTEGNFFISTISDLTTNEPKYHPKHPPKKHLEEPWRSTWRSDRPREIPFILALLFEMKLSDEILSKHFKFRSCIIV